MNKGVSILVCSYNASLSDILTTINSAIKQKGIETEIIFCDDCSKNNYFNEIFDYCKKVGYRNILFNFNERNVGTVRNLLGGDRLAKYDYVKAIGAGDAFYDENTCSKVIDYMIDNKLDYCFTDAVYFYGDQVFNVRQPVITDIYDIKTLDKDRIIKNLAINADYILGASIFVKRDVFSNYLEQFAGKVIYEEDVLLIAGVCDGRKIAHYPHYGVYYEYGAGISTNVNSDFRKLLVKDTMNLFEYLAKSSGNEYCKKGYEMRLKGMGGYEKVSIFKKLLFARGRFDFITKSRLVKKTPKEKPNFAFYKACKSST